MREFFASGSAGSIAVIAVMCVAAYLVGAINFATVFAAIKGKDVRKLGSGNPGTMNMMRSVGKGWGALTFICDCAKGVIFAVLGMYVIGTPTGLFVLGGLAVLGHMFPVYSRFRGGKGVATSIGVYLVACPIVAPIVFVVMVLILLFVKYGFIGSIAAITTLSIYSAVKFRDNTAVIIINVILLLLVLFAHRGNFVRLFKGKENTLSIIGKNSAGQEEIAEEKQDSPSDSGEVKEDNTCDQE